MLRFKREGRAKSRGQAMVEFMLSVVFVLVVVFWAVEFMLLMYSYVVLADAAKEGVRYAVVHGSGNSSPSGPGNVGAVQNVVIGFAGYLNAGNVAVNYPDNSNQAPSRVQVLVSYPYQPIFALPWIPPTIHAAAEGRIAN